MSIPVRSHFFIAQGKVSFYSGLGLRTDIRLGKAAIPAPEVGSIDNGHFLAMSAEFLLGLEVKVSPQITLNLEPTFSRGITRYDEDIQPQFINALSANIPMMVEHPQRLGFSFGVTFIPGL